MRREFFAATALSSLVVLTLSASASAQTGSYDWSGFYVGGAFGAKFDNEIELDIPDTDPGFDIPFVDGAPSFPGGGDFGTVAPFPTDFDFDGRFNVGAIAGYNMQMRRFVFGLESDISRIADARETFTDTSIGDDGTRSTSLEVYGGLDALFTLRPRVGVAVTDRLLLFGTGGLAIGHASVGSNASITQIDAGKSSVAYSGDDSQIKFGFAAGGGAEYAINERARIRLEGLYYDLGTLSTSVTGEGDDDAAGLTVQPYDVRANLSGVTARLGFTIGF